MSFVNLGTRNKGTFFEYLSAYSLKTAKFPGSEFSVSCFLGVGQGISNQHCHETFDIEKNSLIFVKEFEKGLYSKTYFSELVESYMSKFRELEKICKIKNFKSLDNEKLADYYAVVSIAMGAPNPAMLQALYTLYLNDFVEKNILKILKKNEKNEKYINEVKSLLLTNIKLSITDEEETLLHSLRKMYQDRYKEKGVKIFLKDPKIKKEIERITENFGWFHMEYSSKPFTCKDYENHIKQTIDDGIIRKTPINQKKEIKKRKIEFFSKHPNSKYLSELTDVLQEFAYILDHTKVIVVKGRHLTTPLFEEIAKRIGITGNDLLLLVPPEIIHCLMVGKKVDKKLIETRKNNRAVLLRENMITWYEGAEALVVSKKYLKEDKMEKADSFKGVSAYPGVVRGRATIVKSIIDYKKFKKGDIMITHDGSAELTIFLKEAGAIVTNEGGIICHAAIVAREMKTPCIVGAKIATKVIKDGDLVEVDADRGIVKILKN